MTVQYFRQEGRYSCSLAVLRMVLGAYGITVSEKDLYVKVEPEYGPAFTNLWNTTIAKLACEYNIPTTMIALWPLFKKHLSLQAVRDYEKNPETMDFRIYENKRDKDTIPEPLTLAYSEMFKAMKTGCKSIYGSLTETRIIKYLQKDCLIQTSIKLHKLYPGYKHVFHSILLTEFRDGIVTYHDPAHGESKTVEICMLRNAMADAGAGIIYS